MRLLKIFPIILLILFAPLKTFADAPDISYGNASFNFLQGYYTLTNNVKISFDNHGFKATLSADEAKVHMLKKKCLATGKVTLTQEKISLSCDEAFAEFDQKNAILVGKVNFQSKENLTITADKGTYNWDEKVADFYGKVKIKADKKFKADKNMNLKETYEHVRYNVETNEILQLDKNFDSSKIVIPDFEAN